MKRNPILAITALALLALAAPALATNGYFSLGYGTPYKGMAGAGQALHLSTLASATNPATIAFVKGYDIGVGLFNPNREYTRVGQPLRLPRHVRPRPRDVRERLDRLRHAEHGRRLAPLRASSTSASPSTATAA